MSKQDDHGDGLPRRVTRPQHHAAGAPAVASAMRHALTQMGPARTYRTLAELNQRDGFDCPGCAWPDPDGHRHAAEFCENGAKAVAEEATTRRADASVFSSHTVAELAAHSDYFIGKLGRLTEPLHLAPGDDHYRPVSWDQAYEIIARHLQGLASPNEAAFYTSGRTSNEAAFVYQAFVRALGTNNLPDCSNLCHKSSGVALSETTGTGKGSVTLEDIHQADLLVVVGQNPGTNHPRMLSALELAKQRGAKIISVNPLPEAGLTRFNNPQTPRGMLGLGRELSDLYLPIRLNGDLALFQAVNRRLIERDQIDHEFIATYTDGFDQLKAHLAQLDEDAVRHATGLSEEDIDRFTAMAVRSKRTIVCWAMGLTQHKNSVPTLREVVNFVLLRGNIGRPGSGLCPVRGHSNVQGDHTMGIVENPRTTVLDGIERALGFPMPRDPGFDVVDTIRAMRDGRVRVFFAMGGNFLSAAPDTEATAQALRGCRLTVHVATKPNRSHLVHGEEALILPTLGRTERDVQHGREQFVTVEDSMSAVHASRGTLEPTSGDLRSEVRIVCELAHRTVGDRGNVRWLELADDYGRIRDLIAEAIAGFERFNERIAEGFTLPHPPRDSRTFKTDTGRAHMTVNQLQVVEAPEGALLLQTVRSHDQYNTTIYGLNDRYRGIHAGRRVILINPQDMLELGIGDGDVVDLIGIAQDGVERRAERFRAVSYPSARGCAAAYFPEANALVPLDSQADGSGTPTSKSVFIRLVPHPAGVREPVLVGGGTAD